MPKRTQEQMLAHAQQRMWDANRVFVDMQRGPNPLTSAEIEHLATTRPNTWGRFRNTSPGGET